MLSWLCPIRTSTKAIFCGVLLMILASSKQIGCESTDNDNLTFLPKNSDSDNIISSKSIKEQLIDAASQPHSRQKRFLWITDDGRLALPPGTVLSLSPTISMPLVRYPPEGFTSNLTISFPVTSKFY